MDEAWVCDELEAGNLFMIQTLRELLFCMNLSYSQNTRN